MDCVPLVDGFGQLQNDCGLRLVVEGKNEPPLDVFVVDVVVECGSMESQVLLEEVDGVFTSRNHQRDLVEGDDGLSCEFPYLRLLDDLLIESLCVVIGLFRLGVLSFLWGFGLPRLHVESYLAQHILLVVGLISVNIKDDHIFVLGGVGDLLQGQLEEVLGSPSVFNLESKVLLLQFDAAPVQASNT